MEAVSLQSGWRSRVNGRLSAFQASRLERELAGLVYKLGRGWLGTPWGRGRGQAQRPGPTEKINCGSYVGRVLQHAGFVVDVAKLQRQPSGKIIETFVGRSPVRRFSHSDRSVTALLTKTRSMGSGLFIIGLDLHVGLLVQTGEEARYLHSNWVDGRVVDEPAATAVTIADSRLHVVGKILSHRNLEDWLRGRRIEVVGRW